MFSIIYAQVLVAVKLQLSRIDAEYALGSKYSWRHSHLSKKNVKIVDRQLANSLLMSLTCTKDHRPARQTSKGWPTQSLSREWPRRTRAARRTSCRHSCNFHLHSSGRSMTDSRPRIRGFPRGYPRSRDRIGGSASAARWGRAPICRGCRTPVCGRCLLHVRWCCRCWCYAPCVCAGGCRDPNLGVSIAKDSTTTNLSASSGSISSQW